jgi:hypothetical protein
MKCSDNVVEISVPDFSKLHLSSYVDERWADRLDVPIIYLF